VTAKIRKALPYLALIAIVVGFANFFWFLAESTALGGDGLNGFARDGHFYVTSHGSQTEVSEATWVWSRVHAASVVITHPLALAGMAYLLLQFVFPSMMLGRTSQTATDDRAQLIRSSGPLLTSARTAGRVGQVSFSGPLLEVSVYPAGIVIKPVFMKAHAILANEIRDVVAKRGVFGRRVEIAHTGVDSTTPFVLFGPADSLLVRAIEHVAAQPPTPPDDPAQLAMPSPLGGAAAGFQAARPPAGIMAMLDVFGIGVGVVMIGIGFLWMIPNLGIFGPVWTTFAAVITVSNLRRILARR
jgi:hypothetical protein